MPSDREHLDLHSAVNMPSIERCASPEQMPHLEPLSAPDNSLHDPSIALAPPSPSGVLHESTDHDFGQFMRGVTAPLKLSLVLENKGNVARDHLASERTYLAYVRTSLACASAGVGARIPLHSCFHPLTPDDDDDAALVQLLTLSVTSDMSTSQQNGVYLINRFAKPLGATTILFGLIILVFGTHTHHTMYRWARLTKPVSPSFDFYRPRSLLCHTVCTRPRILSRGTEVHHDDLFCPRVAGLYRLQHHYHRDVEFDTRGLVLVFPIPEANAGWDCQKM